jgi:hypothetical protein
MPTIVVMSTSTAEHNSAVTLRENVEPAHLESEHHATQLIERIGWASPTQRPTKTPGPSDRAVRQALIG